MPTDGVDLGLQNTTLWVLEAGSLAWPPEALGQDGSLPAPAAGAASMLGLWPRQASLQGLLFRRNSAPYLLFKQIACLKTSTKL